MMTWWQENYDDDKDEDNDEDDERDKDEEYIDVVDDLPS